VRRAAERQRMAEAKTSRKDIGGGWNNSTNLKGTVRTPQKGLFGEPPPLNAPRSTPRSSSRRGDRENANTSRQSPAKSPDKAPPAIPVPTRSCSHLRGLVPYVTEIHGYNCDNCNVVVAMGTELHGCRLCDLDLCGGCLALQQKAAAAAPPPLPMGGEEGATDHMEYQVRLQADQNHRLDGLSQKEKEVIQDEVLNHHSHVDEVHSTQVRIVDAIFNNRFTLRDIFQKFDVDDSGTVTAEEFHDGLFQLGLNVPLEELNCLLEASDMNHDGEFQFDEFVAKLRPTRMEVDAKHQQEALEAGTPQAVADQVLSALFAMNRENIWQTFKEFDSDGNGWISKKEMKEVVKSVRVVGPMGMAAQDFNALWKALDDNGDGRVNWIEWLEKMKTVRQDIEDVKKYE